MTPLSEGGRPDAALDLTMTLGRSAKAKTGSRTRVANDTLRAFRRAELEHAELRRLRERHPQWSGLHFHPELIAPDFVGAEEVTT